MIGSRGPSLGLGNDRVGSRIKVLPPDLGVQAVASMTPVIAAGSNWNNWDASTISALRSRVMSQRETAAYRSSFSRSIPGSLGCSFRRSKLYGGGFHRFGLCFRAARSLRGGWLLR